MPTDMTGSTPGFIKAGEVIARSAVALTLVDAARPDMPLLLANDRFCWLTGYRMAEVLGRNCRFLQGGDPGVNDVARAEIRRAIAQRAEVQVVLRNQRKDGTPFDNLVFLHPVTLDGHDYMLGSQFELAELGRAKMGLTEHAAELSEDLLRIAGKLDTIGISRGRHLAEVSAFLVGRRAG